MIAAAIYVLVVLANVQEEPLMALYPSEDVCLEQFQNANFQKLLDEGVLKDARCYEAGVPEQYTKDVLQTIIYEGKQTPD